VGALATRVVDRGQPAGEGAAPGGQQLAGVGQLVKAPHPRHPVGVEQRLVGAVGAGQRAGVGGDQLAGGLAAADLEGDHGHAARGRLGQRGAERRRLADGLQEQRHHPGARQLQGVVEVGRGGGDQLHAGGDDQVEAQPAVVVEQGGEHRAGVADHRDRAAGQAGRLGVPTNPQAVVEVEEAHAVAAAHRHAGVQGDPPQPLGQGRPAAGWRDRVLAAREDHRGPGRRRRRRPPAGPPGRRWAPPARRGRPARAPPPATGGRGAPSSSRYLGLTGWTAPR
jgi:hypothetical protein